MPGPSTLGPHLWNLLEMLYTGASPGTGLAKKNVTKTSDRLDTGADWRTCWLKKEF